MKCILSSLLCLTAVVSNPPLQAATVIVNTGTELGPVADTAFGIHTSVYANYLGDSGLPGRLDESGVRTLRYPGGG
jgi:hypothetical protein